jgi:A/G-specific adenine glycosylase
VVVRRRGRILLLRWPKGRRWAGLWDFPRFPIHVEHLTALHQELIENVRELTGVTIAPGQNIATLTHGVTRFRITLDCYRAEYRSCDRKTAAPLETQWVRTTELDDYPLSSTGRKLANLVKKRAEGGGRRAEEKEL